MTEDSKRSLRNDVNLIQNFIKKEAMKLNEDASLPAAAISATPASKPSIDTNAPCATCGGSATSSGTPGSSTCTCPTVTETAGGEGMLSRFDALIDELYATYGGCSIPQAAELMRATQVIHDGMLMLDKFLKKNPKTK